MSNLTSENQSLAQARALAQQNRTAESLALLVELCNEHPNFSEAWYTRSFLEFREKHIEQAKSSIKKACDLAPENINYAFQQIQLYESINRPDVSFKLAQQLASKPLTDSNIMTKIARLLELNEDFNLALKLYQQLSEKEPNNANWLLKKASMYQFLGKIDRANSLCNQALAINHNHPDGHFLQSHLKKQTKDNNHISALQNLSKQFALSNADRAKVLFALAKEFEDCQDFEASFEARQTGADYFRQTFKYDLQSDLDFMKQIVLEFDKDFVQEKITTLDSKAPIFIVGLPRSGTTLLDRIITSHSEVKPAGELKQLNECVLEGLQSLGISPNLSRTQMVTASKQIDFSQLGQKYLQTSCARAKGSPRFTDKFPQNSYYVGMILKAMPHAKVIIMQRHPVAVCYAVYKQMFSNDSYPYSYNLEEMAHYYNQHNKLLNHWQAIGDDAVKTVYYEDLVNDLETQAKSIISFLDLPWQPQCVDFHKNTQPTATASASQVREKLYTSSIDLWRNYEQQLQPLIKLIEDAE